MTARTDEPDEGAALPKLAYDEAVRTTQAQQKAISELRSRTGLLITAASISTSFLGSSAANGQDGFPLRFLWAMVPFAVSLAIAIAIVNPWSSWEFVLDPEEFDAFASHSHSEALSRLSRIRSSSAHRNQTKLTVMSYLFATSSMLIMWSIIAWIVLLSDARGG